jgi:DNA-binding winged helix-turn-helix (wHTH) protein
VSHELVFSNFVLRPLERQLLSGGQPLTLGARAFDVLSALVARAAAIASRPL